MRPAKTFPGMNGDIGSCLHVSARTALDHPAKSRYDTVISDYRVHNMNDPEFLVQVRLRYGKSQNCNLYY